MLVPPTRVERIDLDLNRDRSWKSGRFRKAVPHSPLLQEVWIDEVGAAEIAYRSLCRDEKVEARKSCRDNHAHRAAARSVDTELIDKVFKRRRSLRNGE